MFFFKSLIIIFLLVQILATHDDIEDIRKEIAILSDLNSPHTTKYYGSYIKGSQLWIIMELCQGGSCLDLVIHSLTISDSISTNFFFF